MADTLKLETQKRPEPTQDRGPLMNARQLAKEEFHGAVTSRWVRDNVPGKITLSHSKVVWFRNDVRAWISERSAAA